MSSAHLAVADSPLLAHLHPAAVQQCDRQPVSGRRAGSVHPSEKKGPDQNLFFPLCTHFHRIVSERPSLADFLHCDVLGRVFVDFENQRPLRSQDGFDFGPKLKL